MLNRCYSLDIFSKLNDKSTDKILHENKKNNQFNIVTYAKLSIIITSLRNIFDVQSIIKSFVAFEDLYDHAK